MKPKKNESKNIKQNRKPKECKTERQKSPTPLLQMGNRCDQQSHGQPVCFLTHSRTHYPLCKQQASLLPTSPDQQAPASVHASKDSVLELTGSHFHSKTVDTQRYTISPVCKLQLCFYLYLIFIQQILTEHLPYARHCSRCRGYSSDESEKIFVDLNIPDLLCDLIYDTQYHCPYVATSCVFFSSKLHEGKEAPSFIYIVSLSTEPDSAVRNLA